MNDFEAKVLASLSVLRSQMDTLLGVGQPGRLHEIEQRLIRGERVVQRAKGAMGAFGLVLTVLHLVISFFGARHR